MNPEEKIEAFTRLGDKLRGLTNDEIDTLAQNAAGYNNWFTTENVTAALSGIAYMLEKEKLTQWVQNYDLDNLTPKKVGIVMAGNIPAVGFHDFLSVIMAGHQLYMKLSHQDPFLMNYLVEELTAIAPELANDIHKIELLKNMDAIIATGSDNSARYFEYYFSKIPHIIRKNRTSCAILTGNENDDQLTALGKDVFQYFGLGCRNVSKLFVPADYNFEKLIQAWSAFEHVIQHHKYHNNYDYNKSIYLVNKEDHLDSGFLLLRETPDLVSPIAVLYFEKYNDSETLERKLESQDEKIQCVVGQHPDFQNLISFGEAQSPELTDYADNVDTMAFLASLK